MHKDSIGMRIRARREAKGLSQRVVSVALDCPVTQISRYENGHTKPTIDALYRLAEVLDCAPTDLLPAELV